MWHLKPTVGAAVRSAGLVSLVINLLGKPHIERDGARVQPPRGRKPWALLAYLLLCERPPPRVRLASLLFPDADDPLAALRWSLAELRRVLGDPLALRGDPPVLQLSEGSVVDVLELTRSEAPGVGPQVYEGELLEGMSFGSSAAFESWLSYERRHLFGASQALLHDAALERLASGNGDGATELAVRLVALDPLEQRSQELLIRCLARAGDHVAAEGQLAVCEELFARELGAAPGPELRRAAKEGRDPAAGAAGDRAAALGQLEAGRAALDAGAVEPGLECLRLACGEAAACGDTALHAHALAALGSALVHAVRGRDQEGAAALHEALALAEQVDDRATAALVLREIGYIDVQAGRGSSAGRWLARATELAKDHAELSAVLGVRGMALSDRAYYPAALKLLERSAELAAHAAQGQQAAFSLSLVGRIHMLRGDVDSAIAAVDSSLGLVASEGWTAFRPWPEALRAELSLRAGQADAASERLDQAFRLACRLGDPCWEGAAARAMGLVCGHQGDSERARAWLDEARARVARVSDPYEWVHGYVLDALAGVAVEGGHEDAAEVVDDLERLAARTGMRELVVRAQLHRTRLGDASALDSARLLAAEIENPALEEALTGGAPAL